ncbi:MAG: polysaccharide deacetylase family protein, partial [Tannerella sp.]|nr:polysaccharide deacetylase family protein [Tannerella sp.]
MKQFIFSFAAGICNTSVLSRIAGPLLIHPFYHTVSDEYLPHIHPLYTPKSVGGFKQDLDFLSGHFDFLCIKEVKRYAQPSDNLKKNACHLSFDDGLRGVYETVLPVLFQKGIPATVFINSAFVDNRRLFYRHKAALLIDRLNHHSLSKATQAEI